MSAIIVSKRYCRSVYKTNHLKKYYGSFMVLKSLTTSGIIKDYAKQSQLLMKLLKIGSYNTFLRYLRGAEQFGFIRLSGRDIYLQSWHDLAKRFDLRPNLFTEIEYDTKKENILPGYIVDACEIAEHQYKLLLNVAKKIHQNTAIRELLGIKQGHSVRIEDARKLLTMQMVTFRKGAVSEEQYKLLHSINACTDRSAATMANTRTLKSTIENIAKHKENATARKTAAEIIAYMKRKLHASGIAEVKPRIIKSDCRSRANFAFYEYTRKSGWDKSNKQTLWFLPDAIELKLKVKIFNQSEPKMIAQAA